ncbi:hypothetical protein CROQUDRAFT_96740 [Cronartium quercuum f. sp. fusiforme G11]|uniref:Uncharacterized protein n=1 Tax=Cronartium quercuum f. sp. fusiforme G11 TaxID=708437 RepID=A0A9P6NFH7_9BASI|nr:hypothetical protein CROQUDRAFT_96740 [Cronartium quercuum f. sp. fusiforme G11]
MYQEGNENAFDNAGSKDEVEDEDEDEQEDIELNRGVYGGLLTEENITFFQKQMQDVILPTGITRLPSNLGQSNHGKLKAIQWHSLFAYLIPLVIPELYVIKVDEITPESN